MRRIKTYKRWGIYRLTKAEANDVGGDFAAFLPETDPGALDDPEWVAHNIQELIDFIGKTEPQTADQLFGYHIQTARIKSNNGGRGFARNVERLLWETWQTRSIVVE